MTAIDRLAERLRAIKDGRGGQMLNHWESDRVAHFIYEEYLPSQIIGMKGAAEILGLPTSNTLTMRLARGHDLGLAVPIDGNRITTKDAVEAYGEMHPSAPPVSDDVSHKEAS